MATDIPRARELLVKAGQVCTDFEVLALIEEALSLMTRKPKPNGRTISRKVTPEIVEGVLRIKAEQPHLTYVEIGNCFRISGGRVSEILNGHRTVENPGMAGDGLNREMDT